MELMAMTKIMALLEKILSNMICAMKIINTLEDLKINGTSDKNFIPQNKISH
jgi:hypothetical protein